MAGGDAPAADGVLRHPPCNDGRAVAGDVIALAGLKVPVVGLLQTGEAGGRKPAFSGGGGVERGDGFLQKFYEFIVHRLFSPLTHFPARRAGQSFDVCYYSNAKAVQKQVANAGKMLYTQYIPMVDFDKYALFGNRYPKGECDNAPERTLQLPLCRCGL